MTSESFPVEKRPGTVKPEAGLSARTNAVFLGASVRSGTAKVLVVETGLRTAFGAIAARLRTREPETDFGRGVRQFGYLLIRAMVVIVLFVLTANLLLGRPVIKSLLFAVALAVGLSPELLPAIVSVTLSVRARAMGRRDVIVRRLEATENLGSMDILCTDKPERSLRAPSFSTVHWTRQIGLLKKSAGLPFSMRPSRRASKTRLMPRSLPRARLRA